MNGSNSPERDTDGKVPTGSDVEPEPDWQMASHEAVEKNLDAAGDDHPLASYTGETGTHKYVLESEPILKRLAEDEYESASATVREYLANAETACLRAADLDSTDETYQPVIQVSYRQTGELKIADNGIGFTVREANDILRYVARSGVRDDATVSGQFGMGFLSGYKLVSMDGSFTLYTRSRRMNVPEKYRSSFGLYCHAAGFDPIDGQLDDGRYGTEFTFALKDYLDRREIRKWIIKYAEYLRIPVVYAEFDENGNEIFQEDYGVNTFEEKHEDSAYVVYEDEYVKAVAADGNTDRETLLVSMPIDRNTRGVRFGAPWPFDLRIKHENGVIVSGPNEGLVPASNAEYEAMDPERQAMYIPERDVTDEDIQAPQPTSDRDRLERENDPFFEWVGTKLDGAHTDAIADIFEDVGSKDDLFALSKTDLKLLMKAIKRWLPYSPSPENYRKIFVERFGRALPDDLIYTIRMMQQQVSYAPRDTSGVSKKRSRRKTKVWKVVAMAVPDGDVFMGISLNQRKAEIAWALDESNQVVQLPNDGPDYAALEDTVGWKKLKEISLSKKSLTERGLDESVAETYVSGGKSNAGKTAANRSLTVRVGRSKSNIQASDIKHSFARYAREDAHDGLKIGWGTYVDELVLFPSSSNANVSDWYEFGTGKRAVAACTVGVAEYLSGIPGIMNIDDLICDSDDIEFETNEGTKRLGAISDRIVIHVVEDELLEEFRDQTIMQHTANVLTEHIVDAANDDDYRHRLPPNEVTESDPVVYAPIAKTAATNIRAAMKHSGLMELATSGRFGLGNRLKVFDSDIDLYAVARLHHWDRTSPVMNAARAAINDDDVEAGVALIRTLGLLHDASVDPSEPGEIESVNVAKMPHVIEVGDVE